MGKTKVSKRSVEVQLVDRLIAKIQSSIKRGGVVPLDEVEASGFGPQWRMAADCMMRQYGSVSSGPEAREARRLRERKFRQFCLNSIGVGSV